MYWLCVKPCWGYFDSSVASLHSSGFVSIPFLCLRPEESAASDGKKAKGCMCEKLIGKRISESLNCGVRCNALRQNSLLLFQEVAVERRLCEQISCTALFVCVCDFVCVDSFSWPPVEAQISFSRRKFGFSLHEFARKGQVSLNSTSAELNASWFQSSH